MPRNQRRGRSPRVRQVHDEVMGDMQQEAAETPCDCEDCIPMPTKVKGVKSKGWMSGQWPFGSDTPSEAKAPTGSGGITTGTKVRIFLSQIQCGLAQHPILTALAAILVGRVLLNWIGYNLCLLSIP